MSNPKPYINITTKGSSHKQIIVLMNKEAASKYIKNVSIHICTINCALKSIKLNIIADFISVDDKGIIISTNNIVSPSDLQEIEKYVKSSFHNDDNQISTP